MNRSSCERYYDRVAHKYDDSYQTPYWKFYNAVTWHNIKKYLPKLKGRKVLDIGGGTGTWAIKLAKSGYEVVLADISQKMIDVARRKSEKLGLSSKISYVKADICDLSRFDKASFDLVLAQGDPLSCCDNPKKAVKECYCVLKNKGIFISSVDHRFGGMRVFIEQNEVDKLERLIKTGKTNWFTKDESEQHELNYFTLDQIQKIFIQNKLEVLSVIGKTVLPVRLNQRVLEDRDNFNRLLKLELKLNSESTLLGVSSHLEIVGQKK